MSYKISIIIPVYHVEQYITMCLQSVANQTMTEGIECIIVDDCGGDKSIDIAENFIECYSGNIDFKIVYRDYNGGLSAARNTGIEAATGEYLYFLDSDDEISPNCFEGMWNMIIRYGRVDTVHGVSTEEKNNLGKRSELVVPEFCDDEKKIKQFLLTFNGDIIGAQGRLIKADLFSKYGLFFKDGIIHEDNYWSFFVAKYVKNMAYDNRMTYFHRYNPFSITNKVNKTKESFSYRAIIRDLSANIDGFLIGIQKEYILNNLLHVINRDYFESGDEKKMTIDSFVSTNTFIEKIFLFFVLNVNNSWFHNKMLHILIRIYRINN